MDFPTFRREGKLQYFSRLDIEAYEEASSSTTALEMMVLLSKYQWVIDPEGGVGFVRSLGYGFLRNPLTSSDEIDFVRMLRKRHDVILQSMAGHYDLPIKLVDKFIVGGSVEVLGRLALNRFVSDEVKANAILLGGISPVAFFSDTDLP